MACGPLTIWHRTPQDRLDALRNIVRDTVLETLTDPDAVLMINETGFLKTGQDDIPYRPIKGSAGKTTNCQISISQSVSRVRAMAANIPFHGLLPTAAVYGVGKSDEQKAD